MTREQINALKNVKNQNPETVEYRREATLGTLNAFWRLFTCMFYTFI